jgi:hypothetical protein
MTRISTATWQIASPDLPRTAVLCWPHMTQVREQHPAVEGRFLLDCFTAPKSCDACAAGVPALRPLTTNLNGRNGQARGRVERGEMDLLRSMPVSRRVSAGGEA